MNNRITIIGITISIRIRIRIRTIIEIRIAKITCRVDY